MKPDAAVASFIRQTKRVVETLERRERRWVETLAPILALGIERAEVEAIIDPWLDQYEAQQAPALAGRLTSILCGEALDYAEALDGLSASGFAPQLRKIITELSRVHEGKPTRRLVKGGLQRRPGLGWPGLGDMAAKLYELIAVRLEPERRRGRRRVTGTQRYTQRAIKLVALALNAHGDFQRFDRSFRPLTPAGIKTLLQRRGNQLKYL